MFSRTHAGGLDALFNRTKQSWWERILNSPFEALVNATYQLRASSLHRNPNTIKVVCISDTHSTKPTVPHGHVLIHAGDLSVSGSSQEIQIQIDWLKSLSHAPKIFIAGNHDISLASSKTRNSTGTV